MIHVAFIISSLRKCGPLNQLHNMCRYIDRSFINYTIITFSPDAGNYTYHNELSAMGINIITLPYGKLSSVVFAKRHIQKIITLHDIHIVQSYGFRAEIITSQLKYVRKVTTVRNRPLFNYRIIYGYLIGTLLCHLHMYFIKKFDIIVACSQTVSDNIKPFAVNSVVISNSVDSLNITESIPLHKDELRTKLNLPQESTIFITVSSNLPGKNIDFLINTFINTPQLQNDVLIVAGYIGQCLLNKYSNNKNIYFIGKVTNIYEYYKASNYFVSASLSEGMPNAVLEAMSIGVPVILSNIESHLEIQDDVKYTIGSFFKNNDTNELVKSINNIRLINYNELSNNCIKCTRENYSPSIMASKYQSIYLKLFNA